jgi:putative ABC transport system permease protein
MMKNYRSSQSSRPPGVAERIFRFLFPDDEIFTTLGDLEEIFRNIAEEKGIFRARLWYWFQLFKAVPYRIAGFFLMDIPMFVLSLKIMARSLRKNKVFSFLNIFALTLGLFCFLLIFIYTRYEFTYDSFHPGFRNIYRIRLQSSREDEPPSVGFPLAPAMQAQIPDIEIAAQYCYAFDPLIKIDDQLIRSSGKFADDNFLEVFHFPLKRAVDRPLSNPFAVILTNTTAANFFGSEDPLGKSLSFNIRGEPCELTVTGILNDPPQNTHFDFDLLISYSTTESLPKFKALMEAVAYRLTATYIKLHEKSSAIDCQEKISRFVRTHSPESDSVKGIGCRLQPITDIHLRPDNRDSSAIRSLRLYLALGLVILVIACINYVNLATASSSIRMREIGIRKTIGAQRRQLVRQFIGEALIITGLSFILSFILLWLSLPVFNRFLNRDIELDLFLEHSLWLHTLGIVCLFGIASGAYPALFLSSFKPVRILKGITQVPRLTGSRPSRLRNSLVVTQFTASVVLICVMLFVHQQVRYIKNTDTGFDRTGIIEAWVPDNAIAVREELLRNNKILGVTLASNAIALTGRKGSSESMMDIIQYFPDSENMTELRAHHVRCDSQFLDVFRIPLLAGRNFSDNRDESRAAIINDTLARRLGQDSVIGKRLQIQDWADNKVKARELIITGVIKDFHHQPLTQSIKPLILTHTRANFMLMYVKIHDDDTADTLALVRKTVREFNPDRILPAGFLDEQVAGIYRTEENQRSILLAFSVLAVFIACLGLFGLAAYTAERKTKEIAIRKILGAQTIQLFLMLGRDFGLLVVAANLMGWPLGYYFVNRWMANFAYHVPILLTSGTQIIRVSRTNPADTLRHE